MAGSLRFKPSGVSSMPRLSFTSSIARLITVRVERPRKSIFKRPICKRSFMAYWVITPSPLIAF